MPEEGCWCTYATAEALDKGAWSHAQVAARLLPPPQLKYQRTLLPPQDRGAWNLQGQQFHTSKALDSFGVVSINKYQDLPRRCWERGVPAGAALFLMTAL